MTEAAAVDTAPAGAEPQVITPAPPAENLTAKERQQRITERANGVRAAPVQPVQQKTVAKTVNEPKIDATGRAHSPQDGKFVAKPGDEPGKSQGVEAEAEPSADEPEDGAAADATGATEDTEASAQETLPDGYEWLEIPEDNPLYARKKRVPVPASDLATFRGMLKQGAEHNERLTTAQQHLTRLIGERDQLARALKRQEAAMQFEKDHGSEFWTPEHQAKYQDIKETYGEEDAETFRRGQLLKAEDAKRKALEQVDSGMEAEAVRGMAQTFTMLAIANAKNEFPHWSESDVRGALQSYGAFMDMRAKQGSPIPFDMQDARTAQAWLTFARNLYRADDSVQAKIKAQSTQTEIAKKSAESEAKQREQERLRKAAESRKTNPLGQLQTQTTSSVPDGSKPMTVKERLAYWDKKAKGIV